MIFRFIVITIILLCATATYADDAPPSTSAKRYDKIVKTVMRYQKEGEKLSDPDVKSSILKEIADGIPLTPKTQADKRTSKELTEEAKEKVNKKFPSSPSKVRDEIQQEANKKFVLCAPREHVRVMYQKGKKVYEVEGIFYSYGSNSITIGDYTVALFDLLPEYRIKFDPVYCEAKKKEYVESRVQDYFAQKIAYSQEVLWKLKEDQTAANEKAGYIFAWKEWRSAQEVVEILIRSPEQIGGGRAIVAEKKDAKQPEQPAAAQPDKDTAKPEVKADTQAEYEALEAKANKALRQIANTCSGIDADQGFKLALWGMKKEEVDLIISKETGSKLEPLPGNPSAEVLSYEKGPIQKIEFHFFDNIFGKMVIRFRITSLSEMMAITTSLNDRYGLTDEQKKLKKEQDEINKLDPAEVDGKKDKKDKKKKEEEEQIPLEQTYHWTGNATFAAIFIKINPSRTAYEELTLIKQSPTIIEDYTIGQQRKKAEKLQKEKDQYNSNKKKIDF